MQYIFFIYYIRVYCIVYIPSICSFYFSFIKRFNFERNFSNSALPDVKGQMASNIDAIMIALVSQHCPFNVII